jgi:hypothetical protein
MPVAGTSPRMVPTLPGPVGPPTPHTLGVRLEEDGGRAPFPLSVAPPDTAGYTVRTITQAEADLDSESVLLLTLDDATDYVIDAPYRINRNVRLEGGRNIVWIGGHIRINHKGYFADPITKRGLLLLDGVAAQNRIIHIEGLWIDGPDLNDGIALFAPKAELRLGYYRVERDYQRSSDSFGTRAAPFIGTEMYQGHEGGHSDSLQNYGGHRGLILERATVTASITGLRFDEQQGLQGNDNRLKHVNVRAAANVTREEAPYSDVEGTYVAGVVRDNFEADINGWIATNGCTLTHNTATPITGAGSMNVARGTSAATTIAGAVFAMGAPGQDWRNPGMAISADIRLNSGGSPHPMARIDVANVGTYSVSLLKDWHFGQARKVVAGQTVRVVAHFPAAVLGDGAGGGLRAVRVCVMCRENDDPVDFDVDNVQQCTGDVFNTFTGPPLRYEGAWGLYHDAAGDVLCEDVWIKNLPGGHKIGTQTLRNYDTRGVDYTVIEAAPTLQAEGAVSAVTTGAPTPAIPAHQADDILWCSAVVWAPNTAGPFEDIPTPDGWTLAAMQEESPDGKIAHFWKRATSGSETITLTSGAGWDTGVDTCYGARVYVIRGVPATEGPPHAPITMVQPWDQRVSPLGGAGLEMSDRLTAANAPLPKVNVVNHATTVIHFGASTDNQSMLSAASGWTIGTAATNATGTDCGFQTARKVNVSAPQDSVATTSSAPAQGFYSFVGVAFKGAARYYDDPPPGNQTIEEYVRPAPNGSGSDGNGPYITSAPYKSWDGTEAARLYVGDPPIGDMCPPGIAGVNYVPFAETGVSETPVPGGAIAGGVAPSTRASVDLGGSPTTAGTTAASTSVGTGGAVAGGVAPTEDIGAGGTSETPIPGGAVAAGTSPAIRVAGGVGGALVGGQGVVTRAPVAQGGASAGGTSPAPRATSAAGGSVSGGVAPAPRAVSAPGGGSSGGVAPSPRATAAAGGAIQGGVSPTTAASVDLGGSVTSSGSTTARVGVGTGGAIAGGASPTDGSAVNETPVPGGGVVGGSSPTVRATANVGGPTSGGAGASSSTSVGTGGATASGTAPSAVSTTPTPGGGSSGGTGAGARVAVTTGGPLSGGFPPAVPDLGVVVITTDFALELELTEHVRFYLDESGVHVVTDREGTRFVRD